MKIGIDARLANHPPDSGQSYYLANLLKAFAEVDSENTYFLYLDGRPRADFPVNGGNFIHRQLGETFFMDFMGLWTRFLLPLAIHQDRIDVMFFPAEKFDQPKIHSCPVITVIYDTAYRILPDCYVERSKAQMEKNVLRALKQSTSIIAISECTKEDIGKHYHYPLEKIHTVYLGGNNDLWKMPSEQESDGILKKYGIHPPYLFSVGVIQPRKNYERLIEAFGLLVRDNELPHQLVIAGKKGWMYERVFERIHALHLENRVKWIGYIPDCELPMLMKKADAFIYPSLYEGFGLPVLEAMALDTPVICSSTSSLGEITRGACLYVDPYDIQDIKEKMCALLKDLPLRNEFIVKGRERARFFDWRKTARQTLEVMASLSKKDGAI